MRLDQISADPRSDRRHRRRVCITATMRSLLDLGPHLRCVGAQQRRTLWRACGIRPVASRVRGRWGQSKYDALAALQRPWLSWVSCPQPRPGYPIPIPDSSPQPRIRPFALFTHTLGGRCRERRGGRPGRDLRIPAHPWDCRPRRQSLAPKPVQRPSQPCGSALGGILGRRALRRRDLPARLARHRPYPPT